MRDRRSQGVVSEPVLAAVTTGTDRPRVRAFFGRIASDVTPFRESPPCRRLWLGQAVSLVLAALTVGLLPPEFVRYRRP